MPVMRGADYREFGRVAHELEQERLARQQLGQQARSRQLQAELARERMGLEAGLGVARMQQQRELAEAGLALDERRAGLSEIQEARRQFEGLTARELAKEREARISKMQEAQLGAGDVQRAVATGTVFDVATGARRAMTKDDPLWSARERYIEEQAAEKARAEREELREEERHAAYTANIESLMGARGAGPTPEEEMQLRLTEEAAMREGGLGRYYQPPMETAPAKEIRQAQAKVSAQIAKVNKLTEQRADFITEQTATGPAPTTTPFDERLQIEQDILRGMRGDLREMRGEEPEPSPLLGGLPAELTTGPATAEFGAPAIEGIPTTEAEANAEAARLGISRPSEFRATPPPTIDKMTYEWWYEQVLPRDLAGKYGGTGAVPALRSLWLSLKQGNPSAADAEFAALPWELKITVQRELRRLGMLPEVAK